MIHEEISYSVNKIPVGHGSHPERNSKQYQISYINPRLKFLIQTQQRSYEKFDGHPLPSFVEHRIWQPQLQDMPTTVYQSHARIEHSSSIVRSPCVNTNASLTAASIVGSIDPDREPKRARTLDSTRIQDFRVLSSHNTRPRSVEAKRWIGKKMARPISSGQTF